MSTPKPEPAFMIEPKPCITFSATAEWKKYQSNAPKAAKAPATCR